MTARLAISTDASDFDAMGRRLKSRSGCPIGTNSLDFWRNDRCGGPALIAKQEHRGINLVVVDDNVSMSTFDTPHEPDLEAARQDTIDTVDRHIAA